MGVAAMKSDQGKQSAMSVNFFEWIRDGVRQSVLLGVSDAIEQLGTPADTDDIHPGVNGFLANEKGEEKRRMGAGAAAGGTAGRKRLGKSLKDIESPVTT